MDISMEGLPLFCKEELSVGSLLPTTYNNPYQSEGGSCRSRTWAEPCWKWTGHSHSLCLCIYYLSHTCSVIWRRECSLADTSPPPPPRPQSPFASHNFEMKLRKESYPGDKSVGWLTACEFICPTDYYLYLSQRGISRNNTYLSLS